MCFLVCMGRGFLVIFKDCIFSSIEKGMVVGALSKYKGRLAHDQGLCVHDAVGQHGALSNHIPVCSPGQGAYSGCMSNLADPTAHVCSSVLTSL